MSVISIKEFVSARTNIYFMAAFIRKKRKAYYQEMEERQGLKTRKYNWDRYHVFRGTLFAIWKFFPEIWITSLIDTSFRPGSYSILKVLINELQIVISTIWRIASNEGGERWVPHYLWNCVISPTLTCLAFSQNNFWKSNLSDSFRNAKNLKHLQCSHKLFPGLINPVLPCDH